MSSIYRLFDILALFYVFRTAQISITVFREWTQIKSEPLTAHKKSLANQASFFIAVPISVFVHEAAHALAIIASGGQVAESGFVYRAFWGYVVPQGTFTETQTWMIAIAGTLGSLLTGVLFWLLTRNAQSSTIRYFGLRAARFQIYFSLIYYPIFTLLGFDGDWRTIYNFSSTPLLSGVTAAAHIVILFLFWRFDRQGWFEAPAFGSVGAQEQLEKLKVEASANPNDIALQLQVIDILRRGGASQKAKYQLNQLLEENPNSGIAYLESAALQSAGKASVPKDAAKDAQQALDLGLPRAEQAAFAYELIGRNQMDRGKLDEAQKSLTEAINALDSGGNASVMINLIVLRNQVSRRQHNYNASYQDLQEALTIAQRTGNEAAINQVNSELEILAKHSGTPYLAGSAEQIK